MKNSVMLQSFEWYSDGDGCFYKKLTAAAPELKRLGFDAVWLPPVYKATGTNDVGYGIYDLYDLGEFDQKGSVRTKYGTKAELLDCIAALHEAGLFVYADVVLNHKAGADHAEVCEAIEVDPSDRDRAISDAHEIEAWTGFDFPGRAERYSAFKWHWYHFTGVDFDQRSGRTGIFKLCGEHKDWAQDVSSENGNFDYLMFADIDHDHPDVRDELMRWARWFVEETEVDGFRLDAIKHISAEFMQTFIQEVTERERAKSPDFYIFGEYWMRDTAENEHYLYETDYEIDLFDVGLHFAFFDASKQGASYDLRRLFDESLVSQSPSMAVTFVDNHDTQPGQALTSFVEDWFKAMAYACILLRRDGYPCVFAGDFWGRDFSAEAGPHRVTIEKLLLLRKALAYGDESVYLEDAHCIGFVRHGDECLGARHKLVVVFSNSDRRAEAPDPEAYEETAESAEEAHEIEIELRVNAKTPISEFNLSEDPELRTEPWLERGLFIRMDMGRDQAGKVYRDYFEVFKDERVVIGEDGWADFPVPVANLACFAEEGLDLSSLATAREKLQS
ncbi:MAG: alpha-amylase [Eubacteriales bacterium]|nr:alpha-amylase [Eubacteriales bacterium]